MSQPYEQRYGVDRANEIKEKLSRKSIESGSGKYIRSKETKKKMSDIHKKIRKSDNSPFKTKKYIEKRKAAMTGKNNPMYGKCAYDMWVENFGKEEADKRKKRSK